MAVNQDKVGDVALHEGSAEETFGNEQVRVDVGEPFVISRSTDYHWFPTLHQVSPRELLVNFWCSPDEINPAGTRTAYCWTSDSGKTFGPPVPQGDAGHSWICLRSGYSLWFSYQLRYQGESVCTCRVGKSADGKHYTWSEGMVNFTPYKVSTLSHGAGSFVFARSILERPDGSLLTSMYCLVRLTTHSESSVKRTKIWPLRRRQALPLDSCAQHGRRDKVGVLLDDGL